MPQSDQHMVQTMDGHPSTQSVGLCYISLEHVAPLLKLINELCQTLPVRIHPNLRSAVYCSAMAAGDEAEWEFGWSQFKNAAVASEASQLMSALACTSKTQLLERCASFHPLQS